MKNLIGLTRAMCDQQFTRTTLNEECESTNKELRKVCVFKTKRFQHIEKNTYTHMHIHTCKDINKYIQS